MPGYVFFDNEKEREKPVYRIFGVERLLQMLEERRLALVKPAAWDDPFENFILKSKARLENGEIAEFAYADDVYGQCWSFEVESDAMWRIYSPNKHGVKVKTTPQKLRESLASAVDYSELSAFVGKVRYHTDNELKEMVRDRIRMQNKVFDSTGEGLAQTLLFKREAFKHEQEVRLIYSGNNKEKNNNVFLFQFDPFTNIDEIVFDPRMDKRLVSVYSSHIKSIGFNGPISQSELYEVPDMEVFI